MAGGSQARGGELRPWRRLVSVYPLTTWIMSEPTNRAQPAHVSSVMALATELLNAPPSPLRSVLLYTGESREQRSPETLLTARLGRDDCRQKAHSGVR